jgi:putative Mg2+ transporter-C (MgtC) family protein
MEPNLMSGSLAVLSVTFNLALGLVLGASIGLERQWRQRHAGLATHALVAVGAAAFTSVPGLLPSVGDATRMGAQVVTGIGFLGAGLIMRDGLSVRGLSTAATVWATGAVGVLAGYGLRIEGAETAAFIIAANLLLSRAGSWIERLRPDPGMAERFYVIDLTCAARDEATVRTQLLQAVSARGLRLQGLESHTVEGSSRVEVEATVYTARQEDTLVERLVGELSLLPHIHATGWTSTAPPE